MGFVTKDQIERARLYPVLKYIKQYESDQFKRVGQGYRLKADDAFAVSDDGWYDHKKQIGSWSALDYLVDVKGYGLVDAVCSLLGEKPFEYGDVSEMQRNKPKPKARSPTTSTKQNKPSKRAPFAPPLRYKDNKRIIAYLQSRDIDKDSILACINQGSLYESAKWHNCVFVGRDENGKRRFAALRSTTSAFKGDMDGSDKRYGFVLPPENPNSHEVAVFEAPIDCLSHQTLCKQGLIPLFNGWRLSLSGTSDLALIHFLKTHTKITHCLICTDNDKAGNDMATKIATIPGITTERSLPIIGDDWNKTLQAIRKMERTQGKTQQSGIPTL